MTSSTRTYLKIRLGMAEANFASGKTGALAGIPERYISRALNAARHEMRSVPMECGGASGRVAFCKRGHSDCYASRLHALLCQRDARTMLHANLEIGSRSALIKIQGRRTKPGMQPAPGALNHPAGLP